MMKMMLFTCYVNFLVIILQMRNTLALTQPHILFILADDYGFNDVGYHGSEILTPNLDALAAEGVKLENYYVQPVCTPTRSQLMTGRYQIHTGMQHGTIQNGQPHALPLDSEILPEKLQDAGYTTHMIGKWHLGYYNDSVIPTSRGFDTFYGYYGGGEDYYTHTAGKGYDFRDGTAVDYTANGTYSTHLFAQRAIDIVSTHDPNTPMFMYFALQNPHTPLDVPSSYEEPYDGVIRNTNRKTYAGMVACMDEAIGNVTSAFVDYGLWDDTVLIFSTDNGGQENIGGADNYPLRGGKDNMWEGGMRGVAFVRSSLLNGGVESNELMHVSDWFPTIINLATGNFAGVSDLDGYDQWNTISVISTNDNYIAWTEKLINNLTYSKNKNMLVQFEHDLRNGLADFEHNWIGSRNIEHGISSSPRTELLHNIDPLFAASGSSSYNSSYFDTSCRAAIRKGDMKLITGNPERETDTFSQNVWLFNITADPNEETDLSTDTDYESVILELLERLEYYNSTSVDAYYPAIDPKSKPGRNGGVWGPWM